MCGINGFTFRDEHLICSMNSVLNHRGPDGKAIFLQDNLSLGHTRLSIIDLSAEASQPMLYCHSGRKVCIIFNGEIYNYIEIKKNLELKGYLFSTKSDTEVLMAAYLEWGEDCVNQFNGMWAFCIYDFSKEILFCSRDRFGVKPFYFFNENSKFIFSSEIKAILQHKDLKINQFNNINNESIELYFSLGYIPAPYSIYKNISKLNAGYNLIYDLKDKKITEIYSYYEIPKINPTYNKNELIEEGKTILRDSVKLRMRSDVPVGAFLSGGLDSSSVVGEMRHFTEIENMHTFSIGFEEKALDESPFINLVKDYFQTKHHHHIYKQDDFNSTWSFYANMFDEPFGDYSAFPSYKVSQLAKENVTVVLSGDGGDEIFGGYPIYQIAYLSDKIRSFPKVAIEILFSASKVFEKFDQRVHKASEVIKLSLLQKNEFYSKMFDSDRYKPEAYSRYTMEKLSKALEIADGNLAEAVRIYDLLNNTLPDNYLVKVDRTSMNNSIEVRSPFLDYRFIEFGQRIPVKSKVDILNTKIMMRDIIKDIVPPAILKREKMGFTPPINNWLYETISSLELSIYCDYLRDLNLPLYNFYKKLLISTSNSYMRDFYLIKLVIFGKWLEFWILEFRKD